MPRIVDHDARRRELAAALWRVLRTHGVDDTSVRTVAAEAGWSAGALRHYFSTQDELFGFALQLMIEQTSARVRAHVADDRTDPFARGVRLVEELLPLDETRRGECLVWVAFADRSRLDPDLGHVRQAGWDGTRHVARIVAADLAGAPRPHGLADVLDDPVLESRARRLHVLIDGWAVQAISYPGIVTPEVLHDEVVAELASWT
ncbi:TetR/AcrR family transcriptional regulator [Aeromicrobium sp. CF4.19]|uniref:TetR/AcrR family transcriptional regulator n=1 Tax=Aeromicrobium sp. CF4.19 TaxID=3373082 RepID=UPI003EE7BCE0